MIMVLSVSARRFTMRQFPNLPSSYSSYHPKDPFTELDISDTHVNQLYACASSTLNLARLSYWIPAGRQHVKKAINHCVTCKTIIGLPHNIQDTLKQYQLQSLTWTLQELQLYTSAKLEPKRNITSASLHVLQQEQSTLQSLQIFRYKRSFSRRMCCSKVWPPTDNI